MMTTWMINALKILRDNLPWMGWNLFLAIIPFALSIWLFRRSQSRSLLWLVGFLAFVAFLPNAPYVLTDIIHLIRDIRWGESAWVITLVLVPQYLLFMLVGFEAYVLSLINLGHYMRQQGWGARIREAEMLLHALSAIGVYLGRFLRFNSWDILAKPHMLLDTVVDDLLAKWPLLVMAITFCVIAGLYWPLKQITLAVLAYRRDRRSKSTLPT